MQRFDRKLVPVPKEFKSSAALKYRDRYLEFYLSKGAARAQTRAPAVGNWIHSPGVIASLDRLFHGKCAFCEQRTSLKFAAHFRPTSEAAPAVDAQTSHLYYSWLAGAWENLYLMCPSCNRGSAHHFPVDGPRVKLPTNSAVRAYASTGTGEWPGYPIQEENFLLDPCYDGKYYQHLKAHTSGLLEGISIRGAMTCDIFGLNRPELVEARAAAMAQYAGYLRKRQFPSDGAAPDVPFDLFNFQELEFGGFWYLLLRDLADYMPGVQLEGTLQPNRIGKTLAKADRAIFDRLIVRDTASPVMVEGTAGRAVLIEKIDIRNFKAIEHLSLSLPRSESDRSHEQPALLILGENSAGKSSILEAIALTLCQPAEREGLGLASTTLMLTDEFLGGAPDVQRSATVKVSFSDQQSLVFKANKRGLSCSRPLANLPVFAYGAFRHYLDASPSNSPAKSIISLFKSDQILANPEHWLMGLSEDNFSRVVRALREILSIGASFDVITRDARKQRCVLVNGAEGDAGKTPLALASSGFRSLLGMICEVMAGLLEAGVSAGLESFDSIRAVVLIDEIEAHLHPRWKMQIMRGLRQALPGVTFIATTHDPLCLRGMKKGEAVVVRRVRKEQPGKGGLAEQVELLTDLPDLTQLSVEQLLTSDFFGLASTDSSELEESVNAYAEQALARQAKPRKDAPGDLVREVEREVANALPLGNNVVQQLMEEALLDYLVKRRAASAAALDGLRDSARQSLVAALEGL